jgi:TRAP-type C4-dicarboxylate transport system permease small subunit
MEQDQTAADPSPPRVAGMRGRQPGWLKALDSLVVAANRMAMIAVLALMAIIVFANVMLRYLTDESIVWSEEVARYLMIWLTFLGIGPVFRIGGHIAVDSLHSVLPRRLALVLRAGIFVLIAGFSLALVRLGSILVERTWAQTTPVTEVPFGLVSAAVPVGFLLALWHMAAAAPRFILGHGFERSADLNPEEVGSL